MASFERLVEQLGHTDGKRRGEAHGALLKGSQRVVPFLIAGLRNKSAEARETCAEMLGDRKDPSAVPALIGVLDDPSLFVRQDAMWAIEKLCGYSTGGLQGWIDADFDKPRELKRKALKWWKVNRRYIERNWWLTL